MAIDLDGTGDYLNIAAIPVSGSALAITMACWANVDDITHANILMSVNDASLANYYLLFASGDTAGDFAKFGVSAASSTAECASSIAYTAGTYQHYCGVNASATSRTVYLNGTNSGTDATSRSPINMDSTGIGSFSTGAVRLFGVIAEAGIWNVALTAGEVADLAQGLSPLLVRPESLVMYMPMWSTSDLVDRRGLGTFTLNGNPTTGDHCRVYYPSAVVAPYYANQAPVISSNGGGATASINSAENQTAITTVTATDADSATVTYSISGTDAAFFTIGASSGVLSWIAAPNYENKLDADHDGVYQVTVTASDGVLTDTQAITITVTDVGGESVGFSSGSLSFTFSSTSLVPEF